MSDRNYSIDFIKTAAIIAVVAIHVSTAYLYRATLFSFSFDTILAFNGFARFAVPIFFLSSGLLLGARYKEIPSVSGFYKKRIFRILPPYIFWTLVYYLLFSSIWKIFTFKFINNLLTGETSYQFYFIPTICVLYLLFPLFIKYKKIFLSGLGVLVIFILQCLFLYHIYYNQYNPPIYPPFKYALINLAPFIIGIFLSQHYERAKRFLRHNVFISLFIAALLGTLIVLESVLLLASTTSFNYVNNQWRPTVLTYALAAGALLFNAFERYLTKWDKTIEWLSKYSFGVFFIHVALMYPLLKFIDRYKFYSLLSFLLFFAITITASYLIIFILSKVPKIGRIMSAN